MKTNQTPDKATARPWSISGISEDCCVMSKGKSPVLGRVVVALVEPSTVITPEEAIANRELIVQAVNEHAALEAAFEKLCALQVQAGIVANLIKNKNGYADFFKAQSEAQATINEVANLRK